MKYRRTIVANTKQPLEYDLVDAMLRVIDNHIKHSDIPESPAKGTEGEMKSIAAAFNISRESAKALMINELGYTEESFEGVNV